MTMDEAKQAAIELMIDHSKKYPAPWSFDKIVFNPKGSLLGGEKGTWSAFFNDEDPEWSHCHPTFYVHVDDETGEASFFDTL